jgi:tight adherence protein C
VGAVGLYASAVAIMLGLGGALALALGGRSESAGVARSLALIRQGLSAREVSRNALPLADRLAKPVLEATRQLAVRLSPTGTAARLVRLLDFAGNPGTWTVERLLGVKGALLLILAALGVILGGGISVGGLLAGVGAGALGFFLPDLLVYNLGSKRQQLLRRGLSDALDMLTVCVEAGQGFDAALMQVARAITGPVSGEFARVLQEIQIGKPRGEAFAAMAKRTNVEEMRTFVTALVQADRLGLPIGAVLREQAMQMRLVRRQRAQAQAQKVTVKILFPLMFCIFPALMIVVIGPGAIRLMTVFTGM